jgi:HK97 family phage prohead protease
MTMSRYQRIQTVTRRQVQNQRWELTVKRVDDSERIVEGVASTGQVDRVGDIVEPLGARYRLPLPLLWQHAAGRPVGNVVKARPTSVGIEVKAQLARIDEPGLLRDSVDEAWHAVKHGLVRSFSVGFVPLKAEPIGGGGLRIKEWNWLELSLVTIPANPGATIGAVKAKAPANWHKRLWRKGEVLRVTPNSAWRAKRDCALPPWRAPLSWEAVK